MSNKEKIYTVTIPDEYDSVLVYFNNELIEIKKNQRKTAKSSVLTRKKETEPRNPKGTEMYVFLNREMSLIRVIGTTPSRIVNSVSKMMNRVYKDYDSIIVLITDEHGDPKEHFIYNMKDIKDYSFNYDLSELERFKDFMFSKPYCRLTTRMRTELPNWKITKLGNICKLLLEGNKK